MGLVIQVCLAELLSSLVPVFVPSPLPPATVVIVLVSMFLCGFLPLPYRHLHYLLHLLILRLLHLSRYFQHTFLFVLLLFFPFLRLTPHISSAFGLLSYFSFSPKEPRLLLISSPSPSIYSHLQHLFFLFLIPRLRPLLLFVPIIMYRQGVSLSVNNPILAS